MRRQLVNLAIVGVAVSVAGCDPLGSPDEPLAAQPRTSHTVAPVATDRTSVPVAPHSNDPPAKYEVPLTHGRGGTKQFTFLPHHKTYTVRVSCTSKSRSTLSVDDPSKPGVDMPAVKCDGVPTFVVILTKGTAAQEVKLTAPDDTRWKIAVFEGNASSTTVRR